MPALVTWPSWPATSGGNEAFDDALASFAMAYAEQTVKDYAALVKARGAAKVEVAAPKTAKAERKSAPKPKRKSARGRRL